MNETSEPKNGKPDKEKESENATRNNIGSGSLPDTHEATVAMSREEMGLGGESDETDHEATVAMSREEMGLGGESDESDHEATVALSREEMGFEGESDESDHEATVALSREEMGLGGESDETDHEATVALSREEMGLGGESDETDHEETVALSREETGVGAGRADGETPADSRGSKIDDADYRKIVQSSLESLIREKRSGNEKTVQGASDLEKECYMELVEKEHGKEKYKLEKRLVAGGMGAVYKSFDRNLQRISAMKMILPAFKNNRPALTDFITEAKVTGLLEHPNIIPVHDLGFLPDAGVFFTMKLVRGEDLRSVLTEIESENPEYIEKFNTYALLNIFRKVCDAVSYAHSFNILHRDIKPHNIMVGPYGEVLLMDWGISLYIGKPGEESEFFPREYADIISTPEKEVNSPIKGSPAYMSPEQVSGNPYLLGVESDVFLLGATLYHMFTLKAPYTGENILEIAGKAKDGDLVSPAVRNPHVQIPEELCRIIMRATAADKADRYPDVESLAEDIDALISGKWSQQTKKSFMPGELLMKEGAAGDEAYLILDGSVQVVKQAEGRKIVLGTLSRGNIVGEMSLISDEMRTASVEALEKTEAAVLTKELVSQNLKKLPPYMEKIVSTLTRRLQTANADIHPYAKSDCTNIVLKHLRLLFKDRAGDRITDFEFPYRDLIVEISEDLGLSESRVETAVLNAKEDNILMIADGKVRIPDTDAYAAYEARFKL